MEPSTQNMDKVRIHFKMIKKIKMQSLLRKKQLDKAARLFRALAAHKAVVHQLQLS